MRSQSLRCIFGILLAPVLAFSAELGVTDTEVVIGQIGPFANASTTRALQARSGAELYFNKVNSEGGVHGRKIKLLVRDDDYNPQKTFEAAQDLVNKEKVFALFQVFGTPGFKAVQPMVNERNVLYIAGFTGAEALRSPVRPNIFNVRIGYVEEAVGLVDLAIEKKGIKDLGVVSQDDAFGSEGRGATQKALAKHNIKIAVEAIYQRNENDMGPTVEKLKAAKVKGIISWANPGQAKGLLEKMKEKGFIVPVFSTVGGWNPQLGETASAAGIETYVTSGVPLVSETDVEIVKKYLTDAKAAGQSASEPTLEGYINAMVFAEGLKRAGKNLTQDSFIKALNSISDWDIGGIKLSYSPNNHRGFSKALMTRVEGGKLVRIKD